MAIYDFRCMKCDKIDIDVMLPMSHRNSELPRCCDQSMSYHISSPPMVHWRDPLIAPFRAIGTKDAPVITSTRQYREYMKRNDLVDANDLYTPPSRSSEAEERAEMQASIDQITPDAQQAEQMEASGILDTSE